MRTHIRRVSCCCAATDPACLCVSVSVSVQVGFVVLGPVLTAGVASFVFVTRGPLWGSVVLAGLVIFDFLMYYFG